MTTEEIHLLKEQMQRSLNKALEGVYTLAIGEIEKVQDEGKVDVKLLGKNLLHDNSKKSYEIHYPILQNVPILYLGTPEQGLLWSLTEGNPVLVFFLRDNLQDLHSKKHSLNNAVAIPLGRYSDEEVQGIQIKTPDDITLIADDKIVLNSDNVEIAKAQGHAVRFEKLEEAVTQLNAQLQAFKETYNTHVHTYPIEQTPGTSTTTLGNPHTQDVELDISQAKVEEVKL